MEGWCICLYVAILVFLISLYIFFNRISRHATDGNAFYDYNQELYYGQRQKYDAGTPLRSWMQDHENGNKKCQ